MANSLAALRSDLAREMGLLISGVVEAGTVTTVKDTSRLYEYAEADAFRRTLLYIRWDDGGAAAAPEGEARFVTAYSGPYRQFTVAPAFSAAPDAVDIYELYLAPFELASWNLAVNLAIREAWPQVYKTSSKDFNIVLPNQGYGLLNYDGTPMEDVLAVLIIPTGNRAGWPAQVLPPNAYQVVDRGTYSTNPTLYLLNYPSTTMRTLRVIGKSRHPELPTNDTLCYLDREYIIAAGQAHMYQMLIGEAGGQADSSRYTQLMAHWQQVAANRKQELAAGLGERAGAPQGQRGSTR